MRAGHSCGTAPLAHLAFRWNGMVELFRPTIIHFR